jgi:hypothetical protein
MPHSARGVVEAEFRRLDPRNQISEYGWSLVRGKRLKPAYCSLVDLFFDGPVAHHLSFKCLVVHKKDDASIPLGRLQEDVGFYKAYHMFFKHRLNKNDRYQIRLDEKPSPRGKDIPAEDLQRCLQRSGFAVDSCRTRKSHLSRLMQLADVFAGAVAWDWNGRQSECGAKPLLAQRICNHLGWPSLAEGTGPREPKFNIWEYRPRK